jgi:hypothetical protein
VWCVVLACSCEGWEENMLAVTNCIIARERVVGEWIRVRTWLRAGEQLQYQYKWYEYGTNS